jgi:hypothetical protein
MKRLLKKASRPLYHGTSDIFLDSILANGITPGLDNGNVSDSNSDTSVVYVTHDLKEAKFFAENVSRDKGGSPIVVEVNIDESRLVPDENTFNYDIYDFDKTMELAEVDEEGMEDIWGYKREDNAQYYVFMEGFRGDDPIEYTPGEKPFVGGDIFDTLNQDLAKYPGPIAASEIVNVHQNKQYQF